jgi:hypothetical protein
MADEDHEGNAPEGDEEEEWTEPVDLSELSDGHTTTIVGGFSSVTSINAALLLVKSTKDRIMITKGVYDGDVTIDSTKWKGLSVTAEEGCTTNDVKVQGKLVLDWSVPPPKKDDEEEPEPEAAAPPPAQDGEAAEGEDGEAAAAAAAARKKASLQPKLLTISGITFFGGAEVNAQTEADVVSCVFGSKTAAVVQPHTVVTHAFSAVTFRRCQIYGTQRSAIYGFPRTKAQFDRCDVIGAEKPPANAVAVVKPKRGYVPPPPPPPVAPEKCECEIGAFCDNSNSVFRECTFSHFDLGILTRDTCKGLTFERCALSLIASVGVMIDAKSNPILRNCAVKLCKRECVVVGAEAHPTLRDNIFVGDVRLKRGAVATGISGNTLALNGKLWDDDGTFAVKGFTSVENDPTAPKPKKIKKAEE